VLWGVGVKDWYWKAASFRIPNIPPNHTTNRDACAFLWAEASITLRPAKTAMDTAHS
jgi:hypothetical protein